MEAKAVAHPEGLIRHLQELKAAACRMTSSADEAEDLVQECLAVAVEGLPGVRHPEVIGAWLLQILRRRWYDRLRRRAVEKRAQARPVESTGAASDPDLVRRALVALSPDERRVLELRFFESIPAVDIARKMGKPAGTIRSMIFHALRKFESEYERVCR